MDRKDVSMKLRILVMSGVMTALVSGCSWVQLEEGADRVNLVNHERAADCQKLGRTRVQVAARVGFIPRNDDAIQENLDDMARNQAVEMGGDTIAALDEAEEGRQTFGIYRCRQ